MSTDNLWISRVLVLSTAHMPGPGAIGRDLPWGSASYGMAHCPADLDYFDDGPGWPALHEWLEPIVRFANQQDCDWLRFHPDADVVGELPTFEHLWT